MTENWKRITGFEDYMVSDLGRLKSFKCGRQKILKKNLNKNGYERVTLYYNRKAKVAIVHQLVAMEFLNHTYTKGLVIDHIDENKANNKLINLQIVTNRFNTSKSKQSSFSTYTGVSMINIVYKWTAAIQIKNKSIYLGKFKEEIEAHHTYQKALKNIHLYMGDNAEFRKSLKEIQ